MLKNIFENLNAESTTAEKTMHGRHVHRAKNKDMSTVNTKEVNKMCMDYGTLMNIEVNCGTWSSLIPMRLLFS